MDDGTWNQGGSPTGLGMKRDKNRRKKIFKIKKKENLS